jgi:hypothetical protein
MKNYNELLTEANHLIADEDRAAEQDWRNEAHFKVWARNWYHLTNELPINQASKIEELSGRLACANGRACKSGKSQSYLDGYAAQYAEDEQITAIQEAF